MNELILNVHPLVELPQPPTHQPAVYQLRLSRDPPYFMSPWCLWCLCPVHVPGTSMYRTVGTLWAPDKQRPWKSLILLVAIRKIAAK
jgi:hypothetical protein